MSEMVRATFLNLPPAKQEKIVAVSLAEFAAKGYHQASLNVIVSQAGIAKGSLYQYFSDKRGLFFYIFHFAIGLVRRTLMQVKEETETEDFFTRLEKSLLAGIAFIQRHPRIYGLYLKIMFDQTVPQRVELLRAVRQYAAEYFQSLVRRGLARGEIRADLPVPAATFLLDALFDRFLQAVGLPSFDVTLGLDQATPAQLQSRVRELIDLVRAGLAA